MFLLFHEFSHIRFSIRPGHAIHAVNLAQKWREYLDWDTMWGEHGSLTIARLLREATWGGGFACVSNVGNFKNWTGHVLLAANMYACGRLAWDPSLPAETIDHEWTAMTFPYSQQVIDTVKEILGKSWGVFEGCTSPMGIGFMVGQNNPFGCAPKTNRSAGEGPNGTKCPPTPPETDWYWLVPCDDYDFANYSSSGLGCDRTSNGSGSKMTELYSQPLREILDDPSQIPIELLLFFHNVRWTDLVPSYKPYAKNGSAAQVPVFQRIRDRHAGAIEELGRMVRNWSALETTMIAAGDVHRFRGVAARFAQQMNDAVVFQKEVMGYYEKLSGMK